MSKSSKEFKHKNSKWLHRKTELMLTFFIFIISVLIMFISNTGYSQSYVSTIEDKDKNQVIIKVSWK